MAELMSCRVCGTALEHSKRISHSTYDNKNHFLLKTTYPFMKCPVCCIIYESPVDEQIQ